MESNISGVDLNRQYSRLLGEKLDDVILKTTRGLPVPPGRVIQAMMTFPHEFVLSILHTKGRSDLLG